MALFTGKHAKLKVYSPGTAGTAEAPTAGSTEDVVQLRDWRLTIEAGTYNADSMGTEWGKSITGIKRWTATATVDFDAASGTGQEELMESIMPNSFGGTLPNTDGVFSAVFFIDATQADGSKVGFYGDCIVRSVEVNATADGITQATIQIEGYGDLAYSATLSG